MYGEWVSVHRLDQWGWHIAQAMAESALLAHPLDHESHGLLSCTTETMLTLSVPFQTFSHLCYHLKTTKSGLERECQWLLCYLHVCLLVYLCCAVYCLSKVCRQSWESFCNGEAWAGLNVGIGLPMSFWLTIDWQHICHTPLGYLCFISAPSQEQTLGIQSQPYSSAAPQGNLVYMCQLCTPFCQNHYFQGDTDIFI